MDRELSIFEHVEQMLGIACAMTSRTQPVDPLLLRHEPLGALGEQAPRSRQDSPLLESPYQDGH
jgi:hypothetical protein